MDSRNVGLDGQCALGVSVRESLGINGKMDGRSCGTGLLGEKVVDEGRVGVDFGRG
jgi:hypothetical protein